MDYKKTNAAPSTITRDCNMLESKTGNLYETVVVASRRANQIAVDLKDELNKKLEEFASYTDNLEEIFENREQIEISKFYERLPKPTLIALQEIQEDKVYFRIPSEDEIKERQEEANQKQENQAKASKPEVKLDKTVDDIISKDVID